VFGEGITVDMISTIVEGSNLVVIIGDINSGDSIVIENASSSSHRIESVEFSDGKVISIGELPAHTPTEVSSEALLVQAMSAFEHGDVNIVGNTELTPYQGLAQIVASDILIK
ncbi:calcium-binding protein, partial [Pseudoalteromonas luteoviolacea]|uniref:calcium-binding protein n=1 Tax=Pseudoalteromonas luteoviolacea TaxID=43657 RepID=UPI000B1F254D